MVSIKSSAKSFNLIFNKITKKENSEIFNSCENMGIILNQVKDYCNSKFNYVLIENQNSLDQGETEFLTISSELDDFIHYKSSSFFIEKNDMVEIVTDDIEKLRKKLQEEENKLRQELEQLRRNQLNIEEEIRKQERARDEANRAEQRRIVDSGECLIF